MIDFKDASASNTQVVKFHESDRGKRLDVALVEGAKGLSRSQIQRLLRQGNIIVDGIVSTKSSTVIRGSEKVMIVIPPPVTTSVSAEDIPLEIVYEDSDLLVVDKPSGMVVHPASGHRTGTLVNAVLSHDPQMAGIGGEKRPGIVHRLDKDTSGVIVVAKNDHAHRFLQAQFKERTVEKSYLALVNGMPPSFNGRVETAIGRDKKFRKRMAIYHVKTSKTRFAVTRYSTVEKFNECTLLEIKPITGRTHQIRVHMSYLGCPIVGDLLYGNRKKVSDSFGLRRQFLHASSLKIAIPSGDVRVFNSPLPKDLENVLTQSRVV
ncbi:MAG TPA: RluA family pseudouridine synthase [Chloroflexi bacterium]|nr:RluA family pseudouridine synthase [Chloroflexota bacterium]